MRKLNATAVFFSTATLSIDWWLPVSVNRGAHLLVLTALALVVLMRVFGTQRLSYLDFAGFVLIATMLIAGFVLDPDALVGLARELKVAICGFAAATCFLPRLFRRRTFIEQRAGAYFEELPPIIVHLNLLWFALFSGLGILSFAGSHFGVRHVGSLSLAVVGFGYFLNKRMLASAQEA